MKRSTLFLERSLGCLRKEKESIQLLQGTLDLIILRTLATMGPQHAYQSATRLEQVSDRLLNLNQGTLYTALVRLEQYGWIKGTKVTLVLNTPNLNVRDNQTSGCLSVK